ncbi:MAG TPA: anthrax toxin-like adenylyl cyclase domain-containing protein [Burkholderiaceae bacterium]|nr:anthrax toxin-like adenylyl cyclase domain-containing protein [Burkholderiaceae bacterium]
MDTVATTSEPVSKLDKLDQLTTLGLVCGEEANARSGIVASHIEALKLVAKQQKAILMFRPVNELATGLLENNAAAKGMNVKGKSSDWGPMAGYIPVDQGLSKLWNKPESVVEFNKKNQKSLKKLKNEVIARPLLLPRTRLDELMQKGVIEIDGDSPTRLGDQVRVVVPQHVSDAEQRNQRYEFRLTQQELGGFLVEYRSPRDRASDEWKPLEVMSEAQGERAYTADYDAFAYFVKASSTSLCSQPPPTPMTLSRSSSESSLHEQQVDASVPAQTANDELPKTPFELTSPQSPIQMTAPEARFARFTAAAMRSDSFTSSRDAPERQLYDVVGLLRQRFLDPMGRCIKEQGVGYETHWQTKLRAHINAAVRMEGYDGDIVKHGVEQEHRREPERDTEMFIVTPSGKTFRTRDWDEVQAVFHVAKQAGYYAYVNESYVRDEAKQPRRHSISEGVPPKDNKIYWNAPAAYERVMAKINANTNA